MAGRCLSAAASSTQVESTQAESTQAESTNHGFEGGIRQNGGVRNFWGFRRSSLGTIITETVLVIARDVLRCEELHDLKDS